MTEEEVFFPSEGGIHLEGRICCPSRDKDSPSWGAILCHPHPLYGGNMHNNVISSLQERLAKASMTTLRFNFRGVGKSQGRYDEGNSEVSDALAGVEYLVGRFPQLRGAALVGYSFGAMVGARAAMRDERIKTLLLIAPPLAIYDLDFLKEGERQLPLLLIAGARDAFSPQEKLEALAQALQGLTRVAIIPDSDHFFWGKEEMVADRVEEFLSSLSPSGD